MGDFYGAKAVFIVLFVRIANDDDFAKLVGNPKLHCFIKRLFIES